MTGSPRFPWTTASTFPSSTPPRATAHPALAVAEAGLSIRPTHLLCLAAAAEGALLIGDEAKAASYYQTLLDVYDEESVVGLEEYGMGESGHATLLPVLRDEALAYFSSSP